MPSTGNRANPYAGYNFRVELDGSPVAAFSEVSGLKADGDSIDYREGSDAHNYVRKLRGLRKSAHITFKRGYTKDTKMWDLYTATANGVSTATMNGRIVLCDETHTDVLYFDFTNGWINSIEGAHMLASGNEVAIESAEMVIESLTMKLAK